VVFVSGGSSLVANFLLVALLWVIGSGGLCENDLERKRSA
jgi:hypothetical protein